MFCVSFCACALRFTFHFALCVLGVGLEVGNDNHVYGSLLCVCSYRPAVVMHNHSIRGEYQKYKPTELAQAMGQAIASSQTSFVAEWNVRIFLTLPLAGDPPVLQKVTRCVKMRRPNKLLELSVCTDEVTVPKTAKEITSSKKRRTEPSMKRTTVGQTTRSVHERETIHFYPDIDPHFML